MKMLKTFFVGCLLFYAFFFISFTKAISKEDGKNQFLSKKTDVTNTADRRVGIHDGNLIRSAFGNFGNLGSRTLDIRGEWPKGSGINYWFECPFYIGAEVVDAHGNIRHIFSDSYTGGPRDREPGDSHTYSWEPLPGYFNADPYNIDEYPGMSHKPETWPISWPNRDNQWDGKWIGEFGSYSIADQEGYYVIDDRNNDEFDYYPFIGSSLDSLPWPDGRRGLGIEVEVRTYQWADPRLEDTWFATYDIKNVSDKSLDKVVCGFCMDWDVGTEGPHSDAGDDVSAVNFESSIAYQWDLNGKSAKEKPTGYVAQKILDTPDNLGLTSFYGTTAGDVLSADEEAWHVKTKPGVFKETKDSTDIMFITGTGYFSLQKGETKRYAITITMGKDIEELYQNTRYAQWFYDGGYKFDVHTSELTYPLGGENIDGDINIQWTASGAGDPLLVDIFYSIDDWKTWHLIVKEFGNSSSYSWHTNEVADGINYSVLVIAHNKSGMGESIRSDHFTINNPKVAVPEVFINKPAADEAIAGIYPIKWRAGDADGDDVLLDLFYSIDSGKTWSTIAANETNDGSFAWDTTPLPNGDNYSLKLIVYDGTLQSEDIMEHPFSIINDHPILQPAKIKHISGVGDGEISVNVVDLAALTGHTYELTFNSVDSPKTYHVFDNDLSTFALQDVVINNFLEGPEFDGVRLWIKDFEEAIPNESQTRWTTGDVNMVPIVELDNSKSVIALPADFEIRILGPHADTAYSAIPSFATAVNFQIWNVTDNVQMEFAFTEFGVPDSAITDKDKITIITNRNGRRFNTAWEISFYNPFIQEPVLPDSGDILFVSILKPFSEEDIFRFQIHQDYIVSVLEEVHTPDNYYLKQNYPNPFNARTIIEYNLAKSAKTVIKIFDILGREVITLTEGNQKQGVHRIHWDGRDNMNQSVATGVYLFRIEAGEFICTKKMVYLR
jgi:hypothetical protein